MGKNRYTEQQIAHTLRPLGLRSSPHFSPGRVTRVPRALYLGFLRTKDTAGVLDSTSRWPQGEGREDAVLSALAVASW